MADPALVLGQGITATDLGDEAFGRGCGALITMSSAPP